MSKLITLKDVLGDPHNYSWADSLFLPENEDWNLDSPSAILNLDDLEYDEEAPQFAIENGLIHVLNISDIQDVVSNAAQQRADCNLNDLFNAFIFYYRHDAFISFV
ncbi:hypothetical protein FHS18_004456 [Paenibacillus phyllosphaerae]|uniref:DUF7716 domain-containing protein n=1 Tax=Paenibacillus phyllosphaerae TaxID=274593 RepID=A0A7W5B0V6_9BACL|nr:hypothetical protein [Paenibacillus phyllosphaerae]MBB3112355.1 hypothetical protein [Paenibacillus phyllosphaerae]